MSDPAPRLSRAQIAQRVAQEFSDGDIVNLGIGIPTFCSDYVAPGIQVLYQSETGILNCGPLAKKGQGDVDLINAGGQFLQPVPGMAFVDAVEAFDMIRGRHIDVSVLGAMQVSEKGDLANWFLPSRGVGNVGGAMDLAAGAKRLIVAMEHTAPNGDHKIVPECTFPITARECVRLIVSDVAVIDVLPYGGGLCLREVAPGWTVEAVQRLTSAVLQTAPRVKEMVLS
jgi:3-oxoacid CoA-transferase B subunit